MAKKNKDAELIKAIGELKSGEAFPGAKEKYDNQWQQRISPLMEQFIDYLELGGIIKNVKLYLCNWGELYSGLHRKDDKYNKVCSLFSDDFVYQNWDYSANYSIYNLAMLMDDENIPVISSMYIEATRVLSYLAFYKDYILDRLPANTKSLITQIEDFLIVKSGYPDTFRYHGDFQINVFCKIFHDPEYEKYISDYLYPNEDKSIKAVLFDEYCRPVLKDFHKSWIDTEITDKHIDGSALMMKTLCDIHDSMYKITSKDDCYNNPYVSEFPFVGKLMRIFGALFEEWERLKREMLDKFPEIKTMDDVKLIMFNDQGLTDNYSDMYGNYFSNTTQLSLKDYVTRLSLDVEGSTYSITSKYDGVFIAVFLNIDTMIDHILSRMPNFSEIEIYERLKITVHHEMGHVIDKKLRIIKYPMDQFQTIEQASVEYRRKKLAEYESFSPEKKAEVDFIDWYYTEIPEEFRANQIMGLTPDIMRWSDGKEKKETDKS